MEFFIIFVVIAYLTLKYFKTDSKGDDQKNTIYRSMVEERNGEESSICYEGYEFVSTDYLPEEFVVIDLETTGLEPETDEIIEIAVIHYKKGFREHNTLETLIKPKNKIPSFITKLTGITQEMVNLNGEELSDFLPKFKLFVGNLRIVTFNSKFDMAFLNNAFTNLGYEKLKNPVSCALRMMRRAYPELNSYKLVDLAERGGFNGGVSHRAMADAQKACIVYAIAVDKLQKVK